MNKPNFLWVSASLVCGLGAVFVIYLLENSSTDSLVDSAGVNNRYTPDESVLVVSPILSSSMPIKAENIDHGHQLQPGMPFSEAPNAQQKITTDPLELTPRVEMKSAIVNPFKKMIGLTID